MSPLDLDDSGESLCCPMEERFNGRKTVGGKSIVDLHKHKGLYRGLVMDGSKPRVMFWVKGGKLSRGADHPYDIVRKVAR
jgi:hypothetical protein